MFVAADGRRSIAVVVYPKLWNVGQRRRKVVWPDGAEHFAFSMGELDFVELTGPAECLALFDIPTDRGLCGEPLVVPGATKQVEIDDGFSDPGVWMVALDSLLRRTGIGSLLRSSRGSQGPHLKAPIMRPLVYMNFIDEMAGRIGRVRRGYHWQNEQLSTIRGRPNPVDLFINAQTGNPTVRCDYEEFSRETPLLLTLRAALGVVARDGLFAGSHWVQFASARNGAIALSRMLDDVPEVSRNRAIGLAVEMLQRRPDDEWSQLITLALGILWPDAGVTVSGEQASVEMRVNTARVWERIVLEVFRSAGARAYPGSGHRAPEFIYVHRPWRGISGSDPMPDLFLNFEDYWSIADAKYKTTESGASMDDQYQMFAYSHLVRADGREHKFHDLSLVYPCRSDLESRVEGPHGRVDGDQANLWLKWLEFPAINDVVGSWDAYLERASTRLREQLIGQRS